MRCIRCGRSLDNQALYCGLCGRRSRVRRDSISGAILGNTYCVIGKLAEGGFGVIYHARHVPTGVEVALKVLHADLATDPQTAARFRRESRALANLRDPHTVVTYERGEFGDGTPFIAMELLHGQTLLEHLRLRGALPWREVLGVLRAACRSLGEAHDYGIVHRDLKPANIHVANDGLIKVLDFGVARCAPRSRSDDGKQITLVGEVVGTLDYMAPEQLAGVPCTPRSDVYALGVIAFELICGRRPFPDAHSAPVLMTALLTQPLPVPSSLVIVPEAVDVLLLRCLERDPDHRYQTMREVESAIDRVLEAPRTSQPPRIAQVHAVSLSLRDVLMMPAPPPVAASSAARRVLTYTLGGAIAAVGAAIAWVALQ